jgi:tRNA threonylcarbamoyladenosine biosynthesis protein TsaE
VVGLRGTLGAGKTCFVKGMARGLEVEDLRRVNSPTFVLLQQYPGRLMLYHFDAYRLDHPGAMEEIGCEETFGAGGVSVVEWADHVIECLPGEHFLWTIRMAGRQRRELLLTAEGQNHRARLPEIREALRKRKD